MVSIGMKFEFTVKSTANENLQISSATVRVVVSAGLELMSIDPHPRPTEVET
jgi:hypothetical protein